MFVKESPKFVAELDALLALEKKELSIPESVTSPFMLTYTVKELVLNKLRECVCCAAARALCIC